MSSIMQILSYNLLSSYVRVSFDNLAALHDKKCKCAI